MRPLVDGSSLNYAILVNPERCLVHYAVYDWIRTVNSVKDLLVSVSCNGNIIGIVCYLRLLCQIAVFNHSLNNHTSSFYFLFSNAVTLSCNAIISSAISVSAVPVSVSCYSSVSIDHCIVFIFSSAVASLVYKSTTEETVELRSEPLRMMLSASSLPVCIF